MENLRGTTARIFKKRARHPIIWGAVDLALSGGTLGLIPNHGLYTFLVSMQTLQAEYGLHMTQVQTIPQLNSGLATDALVTAGLYFVYYYTDVRALNPVSGYKAIRRGIEKLKDKHTES